MQEKEKKPRIRFKGFTEAWEQRKFGEIFAYERPDKYIVSSDEYVEISKIPVLTANKAFILGYTLENKAYKKEKESIIFDDFTLEAKFVNFPYMVKSSAIKILTLRSKVEDNLRFNYELLNNTKFNMLGHARHYISVVQPEEVYTAKKNEQDEIAKLFTNIDNLITLHQRKYDKLVNVKKALLEKMFPKNGSNVPEIRFKGFTEAWEQRKLGKESDFIVAGGDIDKNKILDKGKFPVIANALTNEGIVGYYNDNYKIKAPAVTVTGRGDVGHALARNVDFTPVVRLFTIKSKHYNYFLENAINCVNIVVESTGVPQLTVPQLENYEIKFPKDNNEEIKIGNLFNKLDNLITLHQRKLEKLKNIKKSLLEKMFV